MEKVSVVIPTFNRFNYLLNTIKSVKSQTFENIEIIVVNDCSSEKEYYEYNWEENNIHIIHLPENTKKKFGYACASYVRNKGIENSNGEYIAFCDDDDIWFPNKLELQIHAMKENNCKMSSTEGLIGAGPYDKNRKYKKYNSEYFFKTLEKKYKEYNISEKGFPKIWDYKFVRKHNSVICSSVVLKRDVLEKINNFSIRPPPGEDYDCWLRALKNTDSVYVNDICFYYDMRHAKGRNY